MSSDFDTSHSIHHGSRDAYLRRHDFLRVPTQDEAKVDMEELSTLSDHHVLLVAVP